MKESLVKFLRTGHQPDRGAHLLLLLVALAAADMDGVMMHDGKMMMMKAGHPATAMDHEVTMSDGTKVEVDGTVKSKTARYFICKRRNDHDGRASDEGRQGRADEPAGTLTCAKRLKIHDGRTSGKGSKGRENHHAASILAAVE